MTTRSNTLIHKFKMSIPRLALLGICAAGVTLSAADANATTEQAHVHRADAVSAKLVQIVRDATLQYIDVNAATHAKYGPAFGCVSGPDHGAMGVHYINGSLVGDGELDATRPEALIYEPWEGGLRLVG